MRCRRLFLFLALLWATSFAGRAPQEVEITGELHHHLILANDEVRVLNVELISHSQTLMHWHRHDYLCVTLGRAEIVNAVRGKDPVTLDLPDGDVRFVPGTFAHVLRNVSGEAFRSVIVELLQGESPGRSRAHWDPGHPEEDRGLDILKGGTREILFVKDGARVSEVELQAGGVIPLHHHAGPHLVVALTDFELRSDIAGKGPKSIVMTRGQSQWVAGGYSHVLTNTGRTPAKFVTLEFH